MEPKNSPKSFWAAPVSLLAPRGRLRFVLLNLVYGCVVVKGVFKKIFDPAVLTLARVLTRSPSYAVRCWSSCSCVRRSKALGRAPGATVS